MRGSTGALRAHGNVKVLGHARLPVLVGDFVAPPHHRLDVLVLPLVQRHGPARRRRLDEAARERAARVGAETSGAAALRGAGGECQRRRTARRRCACPVRGGCRCSGCTQTCPASQTPSAGLRRRGRGGGVRVWRARARAGRPRHAARHDGDSTHPWRRSRRTTSSRASSAAPARSPAGRRGREHGERTVGESETRSTTARRRGEKKDNGNSAKRMRAPCSALLSTTWCNDAESNESAAHARGRARNDLTKRPRVAHSTTRAQNVRHNVRTHLLDHLRA